MGRKERHSPASFLARSCRLVPVLRRAVQAVFSGQGSAPDVRTGQEPKPSPSCFQDFLSSYLSPYSPSLPLTCPFCLFSSLPFTPLLLSYHLVFSQLFLYSVTYACCIGSCCLCQLIASYLLSPSLIFLISQKSLSLDIFGCLSREISLGLTCIESFYDDFRSQERDKKLSWQCRNPKTPLHLRLRLLLLPRRLHRSNPKPSRRLKSPLPRHRP